MDLLTLTKNEEGKDYVIGDLHGCLDELYEAMSSVGFNRTQDRLFAVGDLIDRGKESLLCLELIKEPWFHSVKGNHEDMMVTAVLQGIDLGNWRYNGGKWEGELRDSSGFPWCEEFTELVKLADDLPLSIEIVDDTGKPLVGFCHAEPLSHWYKHESPTEAQKEKILWGRYAVKLPSNTESICKGIPLVYCGHTPCLDGPKIVGDVRFIDTGSCFKGGYLTIEEITYGD